MSNSKEKKDLVLVCDEAKATKLYRGEFRMTARVALLIEIVAVLMVLNLYRVADTISTAQYDVAYTCAYIMSATGLALALLKKMQTKSLIKQAIGSSIIVSGDTLVYKKVVGERKGVSIVRTYVINTVIGITTKEIKRGVIFSGDISVYTDNVLNEGKRPKSFEVPDVFVSSQIGKQIGIRDMQNIFSGDWNFFDNIEDAESITPHPDGVVQ